MSWISPTEESEKIRQMRELLDAKEAFMRASESTETALVNGLSVMFSLVWERGGPEQSQAFLSLFQPDQQKKMFALCSALQSVLVEHLPGYVPHVPPFGFEETAEGIKVLT